MPPRALVYGDVDLNLIDGSAIWVQTMVQALAKTGCAVTLVLKAPMRTRRLIEPLMALDGVAIRRPYEEQLVYTPVPLSPRQAAAVLSSLDEGHRYDLVVVRGRRLATQLADSRLAGRLWTYLTDVPQSVVDLDPLGTGTGRRYAELAKIAKASRFLLCQTEELRCFLESAVSAANGKCLLFPPVVVIPEDCLPEQRDTFAPRRPLKLVYTGKFAPRWHTYEMATLPKLLAERGADVELHMIGDKIHDDPADETYAARMRAALECTPKVIWHGGHSREGAMRLSAGCDVGLSWRHPDLDASLELSTKVLEFGALGVPVLLNRTPMHERLLGDDYPLFANTADHVVDALSTIGTDPQLYTLAAKRCQDAAAEFTLEAATARLSRYLGSAFPPAPPALTVRQRPLRVGVASHDLKFFTRLLDHLRVLPRMEVQVDHWPALSSHNARASRALASWADVIVCEWCGPNALWYARHKRPDQRLLVRLHRFELYAPWPAQLDIDAVDQVICVSPHYAELTAKLTGWPVDKITVVPNWVDADDLDRPKLPGAKHHLGVIGIAPSRKRLDLALDVLEQLRRYDPRFTLFVKSKLPWDYRWIWQRDSEREHYEAVFRRIRRTPSLGEAVVFDPYGHDVAAWLRRIGFTLSTSDDESFHLAPAEGMASGAVPAIQNWPGADTIYDTRWIHPDPPAMADAIASIVTEDRWEQDRALARTQLRESYALDRVRTQWVDLLTSPVAPRPE